MAVKPMLSIYAALNLMALLATQAFATNLKRGLRPGGCPLNSCHCQLSQLPQHESCTFYTFTKLPPYLSQCQLHECQCPATPDQGAWAFSSSSGFRSHKKHHTRNISQHDVAFDFLSSSPETAGYTTPRVRRGGKDSPVV